MERVVRNKKRLIALFTAFCMLIACSFIQADSVSAASFPNVNSNANKSIYKVYKYRSGDCVLSANTYMLKRAAILKRDGKWGKITNESVRSVACYGVNNVRSSYTYKTGNKKYKVVSKSFSGNRLSKIKTLLRSHPEGIVVYNPYYPHGILVTKVSGNTVYCVDSAHNTSSNGPGGHNSKMNKGIEKYSKTILKGYSLNSLSKYWYVKSVK